LGITWNAFDGMVIDNNGSVAINQINTFVDDMFFAEIGADLTTAGFALDTSAGLTITFDYEISDFNTSRFFTPIDTVEGIIFTRLGDNDGDGTWNVLETDGTGGGIFVDTGVQMPLSGTVEFDIVGTTMEISVNGTVIHTGGIIGTGGGFAPPVTFQNFRGTVLSAAVSDFADSDDVVATYNPGFTINDLEAPVWLIFDAVAPTASAFRVESNAGTPGLTYTVEAFNWASNVFEVIGTEAESFNSDSVTETAIVAADHIDPAGNVRGRVGWRQTGFIINFPWEVRVDQTGWVQ